MKALINGRVLLPDRELHGQVLLFGEKIEGLSEEVPAGAEIIDAEGLYIAPGLVDVHIHGYLGSDVSDGNPESSLAMARELPSNGVTCFLPTVMTVPRPLLEKSLEAVRPAMAASRAADFGGAEISGCHAEGPFINPVRKGAQPEEAILPPDAELLLPFSDCVRLVTLAPEIPGALECIRRLSARMAVSLGHTAADYDTVLQAQEAGADHFTHLFNAMTGLNHRSPGVVGAALAGRGWCELIADTLHVHPGLFPMIRACAGDRLVLITDCTSAGGLGDGSFTLGTQPIEVRGNACRLADGTLAGSVLKLNEAVRNYRDHANAPMYEAVACASVHPAASVGLADRKGSLAPGQDADIVLMAQDCSVRAVWRSGRRIR